MKKPTTINITYLSPMPAESLTPSGRFFKKCDRRVWQAFTTGADVSKSKWRNDRGVGDIHLTELNAMREVQSEKDWLKEVK